MSRRGTCHLEGLGVREGGVVGSKLALEANDYQDDLVVGRSRRLANEGFRSTHLNRSRVSITSAFSIRTFRLKAGRSFYHYKRPG